jgi:hypothetical protein
MGRSCFYLHFTNGSYQLNVDNIKEILAVEKCETFV